MPNFKNLDKTSQRKKNNKKFSSEEYQKSHSHKPEGHHKHFLGQMVPIPIMPHTSGRRGK